MSAPIGPGDFVECVDARADDGGPMFDGGFLVEGRVYQVAAYGNIRGIPSVKLVGQPALHALSGRSGAYAIRRFRPVYRPKADFIASLKAPPQRVKEDA